MCALYVCDEAAVCGEAFGCRIVVERVVHRVRGVSDRVDDTIGNLVSCEMFRVVVEPCNVGKGVFRFDLGVAYGCGRFVEGRLVVDVPKVSIGA